ncbi:MAG TPA: redoxin domain-containing protein [Solirubrobacterales bacterium]|nr:redoxin domain-containing protein [Solirubrobacterales bacterium]
MLLLMLFALIAGAGTALSPCVLPILPAVLGAGVTGGGRRPLGVVVGLVLSFTFAAVALVYVIDALGLPNDIQRTIAVVVLAGFGITLLIPPLSSRVEAAISRLVGAPRMRRGDGFGSGLLLGGGLGLAYFPCAGPILAGVITVSAAQDFTVGRLAVALAYGIGSGAVLYALMVGGRRFADRLKPVQGRVQMAMGAVMVAVAALMAADLDTRFQNSIADDLPAFLSNPAGGLEESDAVAAELSELSVHGGSVEGGAEEAASGAPLPVLAEAPEVTDPQEWFNTDGEELSIEELNAAGKVVLVDFWTYTCINCIRTFPHLKAWDEEYRDDGLVVLGVHTPEFPFEREAGNVRESIEQNEIRYPVVQDNEFGTWNAFSNMFWPAKYLIDANGRVRYIHFGEGEYDITEKAIRSLLAEAGAEEPKLGKLTDAEGETIAAGLGTPETYLGAARAQGFVNGRWPTGRNDFGSVGNRIVDQLPANAFALQGRWRNSEDDATAIGDARIDGHYRAKRVFLVMGSPGRERDVRVLLDGEPIPGRLAGPDVEDGVVTVGAERLYRLVDSPQAEERVISLELPRGVSAYAFTFG